VINLDELRDRLRSAKTDASADGVLADVLDALDELAMLRELIVHTSENAKQADTTIEDLKATIATREAELGETNGRLEQLDRARVQGVKMCEEKDKQIAELQFKIPLTAPDLNSVLGDPKERAAADQRRKHLLARMAGNASAGLAGRGNSVEHVAKEAKKIAEAILEEIGL
jgi:chromosome segregation ATPase